MSSSPDHEVIVTLSQSGATSIDMTFMNRRLTLGAENDKIAIGRTSKSVSKGRVATEVNGLFDCAVMSRNHAVIYTKAGNVFIEDTKSMHGTFVNGTDIRGGLPHQLQAGDGVRFGIPINRGEDSFSPVLITIGINKQKRQLPITFEVPDASESELEASDGENNSENDCTQSVANCLQVVDLTSPASSPEPLLPTSSNPLPMSEIHLLSVGQVDCAEDGFIPSSPLAGPDDTRNAMAFSTGCDESVMSSDGDFDNALFDSSNNDEVGDFDENTTDIVDSDLYSEEVDPSVYDEVDSDYGSDFEDSRDAEDAEDAQSISEIENVEEPLVTQATTDLVSTITGSVPTTAIVSTVYTTQKDSGQLEISKKRKAVELSEITTQDLEWAAPNASKTGDVALGNSPANDQEVTPIPICLVDIPRPSKRFRNFAAGIGYATLGGITAAAATFASLAYTAPSF